MFFCHFPAKLLQTPENFVYMSLILKSNFFGAICPISLVRQKKSRFLHSKTFPLDLTVTNSLKKKLFRVDS